MVREKQVYEGEDCLLISKWLKVRRSINNYHGKIEHLILLYVSSNILKSVINSHNMLFGLLGLRYADNMDRF